jgi:hypothetical protein
MLTVAGGFRGSYGFRWTSLQARYSEQQNSEKQKWENSLVGWVEVTNTK